MFHNMGKEALAAAENDRKREAFIHKNENFILNCASKFSKHYISKSDDEWSIALIAFSNAIDTYNETKGAFPSYAKLLIEHRLTDYFRSQARFSSETQTEPYLFEGEVDENTENMGFQINVMKQASVTDDNPLLDEIVAISEHLDIYGITFMELTDCSPKAGKTKDSCATAIRYLKEHPLLVNNMKTTKQLPIKIISENAKVPRKILERHRKYIITAAEILSGDYPKLAEYLKHI